MRGLLIASCCAALVAGGVARKSRGAEMISVATITLERQDGLDVYDRLVGRVVSGRRSELGFERGGRIAVVHVDAGERVVAGQDLAALDVRELRAQHREIEARLGSARAELKSIRAQLDLAAATRRRQADLFERGVAAAQQRDEAVFGEQSLRAQLGAAEAAVVATQAALDRVDVAIDLSKLVAPFDGLITRRHLDEGSIAAPGAPVLALIDGHREVRVGVPIGKVDQLELGADYEIEIEGEDRAGSLRRIVDTVDSSTRTVEAIFDVAGSVVDGGLARLRLRSRIVEVGYWVPTTALKEGRRGLWSVLVLAPVDDGHRVERRDVQLLYVEADRAFVRGAVAPGELVAAAGVDRVVPGQVVRAVER